MYEKGWPAEPVETMIQAGNFLW